MNIKKIDEFVYLMEKYDKMNVPAKIFASETIFKNIEEEAFRQLKNCASLPGVYKYVFGMPDIHTGYGCPIGGVLPFTEEGVLTVGGCGFDINCVTENTRIMLSDGCYIPVKCLDPDKNLKIFNRKREKESPMLFISKRTSDKYIYRIETKTGQILEVSEDHPILTDKGYKKVKNLNKNDLLVVYPFKGVPYYEKEKMILSDVLNFDISEKLKKKGLLPFNYKNRNIGKIAKILGLLFGNKLKGIKVGSNIYGSTNSLIEVKEDLNKLKIKTSNIYKNKLKIYSKEFLVFLNHIGLKCRRIPKWIMESPAWIKRNFLSSLFGFFGDDIDLNKEIKIYGDDIELLKDVKRMLLSFGIRSKIYGNCLIVLNKYKFLDRIGFEYHPIKIEGLHYLHYLRFRKFTDSFATERSGKYCYLIKEMSYKKFKEKYCLKNGFCYDEIKSIKRIKSKSKYLYDVGIIREEHNFIANNIVVHNCGIRTVNTDLFLEDLKKEDIRNIVDALFEIIPAGLGSYGKIKLSRDELYEVLMDGAKAVVDFGFGCERDLEFIEDHGYNEGANPEAVSEKALAREKKQIGTLGSGNHYLELQYVEKIFDEDVAKVLGLKEGQIVYTIHCGSRGLGHQIGSDYLQILERASKKYNIPILDRELVCAPIKSKEGEMYFGAVKCGINYAFANRQVIDFLVREYFEEKFGITPILIYDIGHNTIKKEIFEGKEVWIHRKGSTRSYGPGWKGLPEKYKNMGQPAIIGGSMGTATYILVGTNLAEKMTFASTCHGAGRVMSRKQAKKEYIGIEITLEKKGIYVKGHSKIGLAEEAPDAYKNIDEVIKVVDSVGISKKVVRLKPLGVIKG